MNQLDELDAQLGADKDVNVASMFSVAECAIPRELAR